MAKIINKQLLGVDIKRLDIVAVNIARKIQPGQFVMVVVEEGDVRLPIFALDADATKGTISLVFKEDSPTKKRLGALQIGESLYAVLGPLGKPFPIKKTGTVICVGYEEGIGAILPFCRLLKRTENKIIGAFGASTKRKMILESQIRINCHRLYISTDDGSYEYGGSIAEQVKEVVDKERVRLLIVAAPLAQEEEICQITVKRRISTFVLLRPYSIDGMGIDDLDTVWVGGERKFISIHGPLFNGHELDFATVRKIEKTQKEKAEWKREGYQKSPLGNVSGIFPKLFAGFPKKKP